MQPRSAIIPPALLSLGEDLASEDGPGAATGRRGNVAGSHGRLFIAAPQLTDAQVASMYEEVAARVCGNGGCGRVLANVAYVSGLHPGGAELPEHIRQAVTDGVGEVEFLTSAQIDAIFIEDPPNTTVIYVGPLCWHLSDVVGIEFGSSCGPLCGSGTEYLFRWNGTGWVPSDPETEGVTVTSWVS